MTYHLHLHWIIVFRVIFYYFIFATFYMIVIIDVYCMDVVTIMFAGVTHMDQYQVSHLLEY